MPALLLHLLQLRLRLFGQISLSQLAMNLLQWPMLHHLAARHHQKRILSHPRRLVKEIDLAM